MPILVPILVAALFSESFQAFAVGNYGVTYFELCMIAFILLVIKQVAWDGVKLRLSLNPVWLFFLLLVFSSFLSGLRPLFVGNSEMIVQYFKTLLHFLFLTTFAFSAGVFPMKTKIWESGIKIWIIVSIFINIFGIYQIIARALDLPFAWLESSNVSLLSRGFLEESEFKQLSLRYENFFRATSFFPEPSALASFNVYIMIFIIVPFVQKTGRFIKSRFLTIFAFIWGLLGLFLAFSLTGMVGIALVISAIFLFERVKNKLRTMLIMFASGAILIIGADIFVKAYSSQSVLELFGDRLEGILYFSTGKKSVTVGESYGMRRDYIGESMKIWMNHPVLGTGIGLTSYEKYSKIGFPMYSSLAALSEMGLLGFLAFIGFFISLFAITIRYIINHSNYKNYPIEQRRMTGILFYVMLLQFVVNFISGNNLVNTGLWAPMAIVLAIINKTSIDEGRQFLTISIFKTPLRLQLATVMSFLKKTGS